MLWNCVVVISALLAACAPFARLIFNPNLVLLFRDHALLFFPGKYLWTQYVLTEGNIPYWNSYFGGGVPFYADISLAPLYPLNIIFLLFPLAHFSYAYSIFIAAHFFLIYLAAYYLLRSIRLRKAHALLWSFSFTWCGGVISCNSSIMLLGAILATILAFAILTNYLLRKQKILLYFLSIAISIPVYSGDPQFTYLLLLFSGVLFLFRKIYFEYLWLLLLILLFSSPQLLPAWGFIQESARGFGNITSTNSQAWSFHPIRLAEYFFPYLLGLFSNRISYWPIEYINSPSGAGLPFIPSFYIGALAANILLFAVFFLFRGKRKKKYFFSFTIILFFQLLAFGKYSPIALYEFMEKILPLWKSFRYPERINLFVVLLYLTSAAYFWRKIYLCTILAPARPIISISLPLIGGSCTCFIFFAYHTFNPTFYPYIAFLLFSLILPLLFYARRKKMISSQFFLSILLLFSPSELFIHAHDWVFDSDKSIVDAKSYSWQNKLEELQNSHLQAEKKGAAHRFVASSLYEKSPNYSQLSNSLNYSSQLAIAYFDNLAPNTATIFNLPMASIYHTLSLARKEQQFQLLAKQEQKLADINSVYYIAERKSAAVAREIRNNKSAMPYFFFPEKIWSFPEQKQISEKLLENTFFPAKEIILQNTSISPIQEQKNISISAELIEKTSSSIKFHLQALSPTTSAFFVWNENYYPAWKAKITQKNHQQGSDLPIEIVNLTSMGVWLPPLALNTNYILDFEFQDPAIHYGIYCFLLWLLFFLRTLYLSLQNHKKIL